MKALIHLALAGMFLFTSIACSGEDDPGVNPSPEGTEVGDCTDGADNDGDGDFDCDDTGCAGSPDCGCDTCPSEGAGECVEGVARRCTLDAQSCLSWVETDCNSGGWPCVEGSCLTGTCSATSDACGSDADCPSVELPGYCVIRTDGQASLCVYETRVDSPWTTTCDGNTLRVCNESRDCPGGASCGTLGVSWCYVEAEGMCQVSRSSNPCTNDFECVYREPNVCMVCGDGVVDRQFEDCDDGNQQAGDGCSLRCGFEGRCYGPGVDPYSPACGCATAGDCGLCGGGACMVLGCVCQ